MSNCYLMTSFVVYFGNRTLRNQALVMVARFDKRREEDGEATTGINVRAHDDLWLDFVSDESFDPDATGECLQQIIQEIAPDLVIRFAWSITCDRDVPDGFGGGFARIDRSQRLLIDTSNLADIAADPERRGALAHFVATTRVPARRATIRDAAAAALQLLEDPDAGADEANRMSEILRAALARTAT